MPLEVFYSYSHKDAALRDELDVHLSQLVRDGLIVPWADRCVTPGAEWNDEIDAHVHSAHIILLLVSPDFIASDYCYGKEMRVALDRHEREHTVVIPIILRPSDWHSAPFARLQALPREALAVTLWPNRDEAFAQIAQSIRDVVIRFQQPTFPKAPDPVLQDQLVPRPRIVDAAMPSHIVKDRATELLVLIRLPESKGLIGILQEDEEAEARPEDVRSKPFEVTFPLGPTGLPEPLKVTVQLTSPDFQPPSQKKNIYVPVDRDSQICPFLLTPAKTGSLLVFIELLWEDAERGNRRLKTTCVSEAEAPRQSAPMTVVQMPVVMTSAAVSARAAFPSIPAPVSMAPPVQQTMSTAKPRPMPPGARQESWIGKPFVKVGLAICVITIGSTFFVFQRHTEPGQVTQPSTSRDGAAPVLEQHIETAAIELKKTSEAEPAPAPAVAAAIKEGQTSLVAARVALAKGDTMEARKHLAAVQATNLRLRELRKPALVQ